MTEDLLALLERQRPDLSPAERLALIAETPDAPAKAAEKPARSRSGSRPRTDASMERRRSWAASGLLPPRLACRFTLAEQAVLAVIAEQVCSTSGTELHAGVKTTAGGYNEGTLPKLGGAAQIVACTLTLDHIAALAGVCRTSVRNALKEAQALGFIRVEERRLSAWRNLPHRITVVSPEWSAWLRMRAKRSLANGSQGGGCKSVSPTSTDRKKEGFAMAEKAESERLNQPNSGWQRKGHRKDERSSQRDSGERERWDFATRHL